MTLAELARTLEESSQSLSIYRAGDWYVERVDEIGVRSTVSAPSLGRALEALEEELRRA